MKKEINSIVDWDKQESSASAHEELLADIASKNYRQSRTLDTPWSALRAVVELHTHFSKSGLGGLRKRCKECGFAYPCPTIQAIEKELK